MRYLLDTHVAIWAVAEPRRIPRAIFETIQVGRNEVYVSLVSLWEIAIKARSGRRDAPPFGVADAALRFRQADFDLLDVKLAHLMAVQELPKNHGDPFDRLLVAQAMSEPLHFLTHDSRLAEYGDFVQSW